MITITKQTNSVLFEFDENQHYLQEGTIEVPFNSLIVIADASDMITLSRSATGDAFISALYSDFGYASKDAAVEGLKGLLFAESGGGGSGSGVTSGEVQTMIDTSLEDYPTNEDLEDALEDYYTQTEVDSAFNTVQGELALKADGDDLEALDDVVTAHTANTNVHVTSADKTAWNNKVDATQVEGQIETYFAPKEEVISTSLNDLNDRVEDLETGGSSVVIATAITSSSTNSEAAGAKAVYDAIEAGGGGSNVIELTQAQYEALVDKNPDALYVITDAPEINLSGYAQSSAVTAVNDALTAHTANTSIHTTAQEKSTWNGKQDALVSGTNIKTINNQSILGSGNIDIQGGGTDTGTVQTMIEDYFDPKEEVIATSLVDLNGRVEDLETGGTGVTIATAITSSSTNSEAAGALATYNAITAATTGGGATYSAGYGIAIDTANTISFNMPITCSTNANDNITIGNGANNGSWSVLLGNDINIKNGSGNIGISISDMSIGGSEISGSSAVAIGATNKIYGGDINVGGGIAIGRGNTSRGGGIAIGTFSTASGSSTVAIGLSATATGTTKMNLNNQIKVDTNNQVYIKDKTNTTDVCIQDAIAALGGLKFVKLTQSEYDQLATKDANTLYIITNVVS